MTTDTDATTDAADRVAELRQQYREWERSTYDGHGRHAGSAKSKGEIRPRRQGRRAKQNALEMMR